MQPQAIHEIPQDITQVTEAQLRDDLTTYIDGVAFAEDELVVTRMAHRSRPSFRWKDGGLSDP